LQTPNLQVSVTTAQPALNQMPTAVALLGNKPMHTKMLGLRKLVTREALLLSDDVLDWLNVTYTSKTYPIS